MSSRPHLTVIEGGGQQMSEEERFQLEIQRLKEKMLEFKKEVDNMRRVNESLWRNRNKKWRR